MKEGEKDKAKTVKERKKKVNWKGGKKIWWKAKERSLIEENEDEAAEGERRKSEEVKAIRQGKEDRMKIMKEERK